MKFNTPFVGYDWPINKRPETPPGTIYWSLASLHLTTEPFLRINEHTFSSWKRYAGGWRYSKEPLFFFSPFSTKLTLGSCPFLSVRGLSNAKRSLRRVSLSSYEYVYQVHLDLYTFVYDVGIINAYELNKFCCTWKMELQVFWKTRKYCFMLHEKRKKHLYFK